MDASEDRRGGRGDGDGDAEEAQGRRGEGLCGRDEGGGDEAAHQGPGERGGKGVGCAARGQVGALHRGLPQVPCRQQARVRYP